MSPKRVLKAKIGELLIERNLLTRKQLDTALEEQKKVKEGKGKKEVADIVLENFRRKAEKIDGEVAKKHEATIRDWEDKVKKHTDWENEVKTLEKKLKGVKEKDTPDHVKLEALKEKPIKISKEQKKNKSYPRGVIETH